MMNFIIIYINKNENVKNKNKKRDPEILMALISYEFLRTKREEERSRRKNYIGYIFYSLLNYHTPSHITYCIFVTLKLPRFEFLN